MAKVKTIPGPPVRTVKVKFLRGCILGPEMTAWPGDIYELPKSQATLFVSDGTAQYTNEGDPLQHDETPVGEAKGTPDSPYSAVTLEAAHPRDPKPKKRG